MSQRFIHFPLLFSSVSLTSLKPFVWSIVYRSDRFMFMKHNCDIELMSLGVRYTGCKGRWSEVEGYVRLCKISDLNYIIQNFHQFVLRTSVLMLIIYICFIGESSIRGESSCEKSRVRNCSETVQRWSRNNSYTFFFWLLSNHLLFSQLYESNYVVYDQSERKLKGEVGINLKIIIR